MRKAIKDEFTSLPVSRQRKYQLRMKKQRRCTLCGERAVTSSRCLEHAIAFREWSRKKFGLKRRYFGALTYQMQKS